MITEENRTSCLSNSKLELSQRSSRIMLSNRHSRRQRKESSRRCSCPSMFHLPINREQHIIRIRFAICNYFLMRLILCRKLKCRRRRIRLICCRFIMTECMLLQLKSRYPFSILPHSHLSKAIRKQKRASRSAHQHFTATKSTQVRQTKPWRYSLKQPQISLPKWTPVLISQAY